MPRTYSWNAWEASLSSPITDVSTTIALDSTLGLRAPGYLVIEAESPTKREYVWFATINGSSLEGVSRGLGGSIAGATDHDAGVKMRAVAMHQMFDDLWDSIGSSGGDLQYHIDNQNDPHAAAGYLKQDDADGRYLQLTGGVMAGDIDVAQNFLFGLADPVNPDDAVHKAYVDDANDLYLLLTGGTMSGPIHLIGDGATALFFDDDDQTGFNIRQTANGDLHFRRGLSNWMVLDQSGGDEVRFNKQVDMDDNEIRNIADPANSGAGMSRGYADLRYLGIGDGYDDADAVAAMGAADDANELRHVRYTDAEAQAAVSTPDTNVATGGAKTASPGGTVSGNSFTLVDTFTINPPNSWGTARIVCRAVWQGAGISGGNMQMQAHLNIDGVAGVDVLSGVGIIGDDPTLSFVQQIDTATDPIEVKIFVRDTQTNGGTVTNRYVDIDYAMYRVS